MNRVQSTIEGIVQKQCPLICEQSEKFIESLSSEKLYVVSLCNIRVIYGYLVCNICNKHNNTMWFNKSTSPLRCLFYKA